MKRFEEHEHTHVENGGPLGFALDVGSNSNNGGSGGSNNNNITNNSANSGNNNNGGGINPSSNFMNAQPLSAISMTVPSTRKRLLATDVTIDDEGLRTLAVNNKKK